MKIATIIINGKVGDDLLDVTIILQNGMFGSDEYMEIEPEELLVKMDDLIAQDYLIVTNEPLILEASMRYEVRNEFSKLRLAKMEEILEWWVE